MKTKCLYIGREVSLVDRMRVRFKSFNIDQIYSPISAVSYIKKVNDVDVVIFEVDNDIDLAKHQISFVKQFLSTDVLFFVVVKYKPHLKNFNITEVNDVFYINGEFSALEKRILFILYYKDELKNKATATNDITFKLPTWKRATDIILASMAILLLLPLFIIVAVAIRFESKGRVFYSAKRIGTGYKVFDFYKFRSMYTGADKKVDALMSKNQYKAENEPVSRKSSIHSMESSSPLLFSDNDIVSEEDYLKLKSKKQENAFFKVANDPRITKVGRIIRNTSIDELPQLFNILKGDMSVVGNRPLPLYEAEMLTSDQWAKRFLSPAGLTGLWQVTKRGGKNKMSADERKQLDIDYANKYSFFGDLSIIFRTIPAIMQHENV